MSTVNFCDSEIYFPAIWKPLIQKTFLNQGGTYSVEKKFNKISGQR